MFPSSLVFTCAVCYEYKNLGYEERLLWMAVEFLYIIGGNAKWLRRFGNLLGSLF